MNNDFHRLLALMRNERHISQKQAAADLGISQALLSHYEKGIRECGLDFVVKAADYYQVSCDYLLGRSPEKSGTVISADEMPIVDSNGEKAGNDQLGLTLTLNKKLIFNSLNIIFEYLKKSKNKVLIEKMSSFIMLAIYRTLRVLHLTNSDNPDGMFTKSLTKSFAYATAEMQKAESDAISVALNENKEVVEPVNISTTDITNDYPLYAPSLLNLISNCEKEMNRVE